MPRSEKLAHAITSAEKSLELLKASKGEDASKEIAQVLVFKLSLMISNLNVKMVPLSK
jgi:hypothetical protein